MILMNASAFLYCSQTISQIISMRSFSVEDSGSFATISLQEREDEHLCALDNLGLIADHHGHLDGPKTEQHVRLHRLRFSSSDVDGPIHGLVQSVKDATFDMNLPSDTGRVRSPIVFDLHMDAKATRDCE
jgi:hypothetical protein